MSALVIDIDAPEHQASDEWRSITRTKVEALFAAHPGLYYETRGGGRLAWAFPARRVIASAADALEWSRDYLTRLQWLQRCWGLEGDPACHDYCRLFRLPRVVRDGVATEPIVIGELAELNWEPTDPDRRAAAAAWPKIFKTHLHPPGVKHALTPALHLEGVDASQAGPLYRLLRARNRVRGIVDTSSGQGFAIRCPRADLHSSQDDGALLFPATRGGLGTIHCFHSHCVGLSEGEWLQEFDETELRAVGMFEGIVERTVINSYPFGMRLGVRLRSTRDGQLSQFARIGDNSPMWHWLWSAAGVEPPSDRDVSPRGDLSMALKELKGKPLLIEFADRGPIRIMSAPWVVARAQGVAA